MNQMVISKEQLDRKKPPKKIGRLNGQEVWEIITKGGLAMVICKKTEGGTRILGAAPHRAIARSMASNNEPELVIEELSKSEELNVNSYKHLVPYWQDITNRMNKKLNG
jgi:hypothetical protein